jgi:hypothetical protein
MIAAAVMYGIGSIMSYFFFSRYWSIFKMMGEVEFNSDSERFRSMGFYYSTSIFMLGISLYFLILMMGEVVKV